jgi:periplasmic divalent cation tolerance protein
MQQTESAAAAYVVLCTAPDNATAHKLAEAIVNEQLAACVNILPNIQSVYRWQEVVQIDAEVLLIIKTNAAHYRKLERALQEQHPYDVPEIIALPIAAGLPAYLSWLNASVV